MNNHPLVSVLMTVYNRAKYLAEAIESVMASTYQNWELIIVDDQSKDRSVEIARQYEAKDTRIKVYVNEQNLGDYPNRNKAASYAKGKYLKYVDADDMIYPHGLEVMVNYMEENPLAGLGLCRPDNDLKMFPYVLTPLEAMTEHFEKGLFTNAPTSAIIRTSCFKKVGGFSGKQYLGDTELWLKLGSQFPTLIIMRGLTWWRGHDDQQIKQEAKEFQPLINRFNLNYESVQNYDGFNLANKRKFLNKLGCNFARKILSISIRHKTIVPIFESLKKTKLKTIFFLKALL